MLKILSKALSNLEEFATAGEARVRGTGTSNPYMVFVETMYSDAPELQLLMERTAVVRREEAAAAELLKASWRSSSCRSQFGGHDDFFRRWVVQTSNTW